MDFDKRNGRTPPPKGKPGAIHINRGSNLTVRELQVLALVAEGLSSREIAAELGIGVRTVETHRERLMDKLSARNAAALVRAAFAHGLVKLSASSIPGKPP